MPIAQRNTVVRAIALGLFPITSAAEVSDKIPPIPEILTYGFVIGVVAMLLSWLRWWLTVPAVFVAAFLALGIYGFWEEPYMREAVLHEQGFVYFAALAAQAAMVLVGAAIGLRLGRSRRGVSG